MSLEHVDVLIVGAGLSGIGAAHHLQSNCPGKTYALLESRDCVGGTWDLFRYPGIRSDSDMYTLGYSFRPWTEAKAIADGPSILSYIRETSSEGAIDRHIRFNHRVERAEYASADARWTVYATRTDTQEPVSISCGFLLVCTGYYNYEHGYTPDFPGIERFAGQVVHPQQWPEDLDYAGRRVVIIGSGATAVTLVPAMAKTAAHVTMLQRSPTYIVSRPGEDAIANFLRRKLSARIAYPIVRWKNVLLTMLSVQLSKRRPKLMKAILRRGLEKQLPAGYDIDTHFKPSYGPWTQRLCLVPDGDLFRAIGDGSASVETDHIDTFNETGIRLASGKQLDADVVVTATGLDLLALGGMELAVDGRDVTLSETTSYKGMMLSGVPNFALTSGYTNASWTLKADLVCEYVCRLLNHMDAHGYRQCMPQARERQPDDEPFIDLASGYVLRAIDRFPKQGAKAPWRLHQNYMLDIVGLKRGELEDGAMIFSRARPAPRDLEPLAV